MYIYKITNNLNNKIYIGLKTSTVEESESYYGSGTVIIAAVKKYGKDNFTKTILERDIVDFDFLKERERHYIDIYDSYNNGYNLTKGGDGALGRITKEETKRKIAESKIGKPRSEEARRNISLGGMGKKLSEEHKRKCADALRGRVRPKEVGIKIAETKRNKPMLKCPHCDVQGNNTNGAMTIYHFDNCKHKNC